MVATINRTGNRISLPYKNEKSRYYSAGEVAEEYGYRFIPSTDIENSDIIQWKGPECNRLLVKDNILYSFIQWIGEYPFTGIIIEEIGKIEKEKKYE